jgi:hypothetical protein
MLDAFGLRKNIAKGKYDRKHPHVVAPLLGRFKGEEGERLHLLLLTETSNSGFDFRGWLERLAHVLEYKGQDHGPAFCDKVGMLAESAV